MFFFFFKQKTAYEMRISDWSSDVCSSDLIAAFREEFSNFQLNTFNGTSFVVQNINGCGTALTAGRCDSDDVEAGLISQGFELEMTATPIRNLQATGAITYARAQFADRLGGSSDGSHPLGQGLFMLPGNLNRHDA